MRLLGAAPVPALMKPPVAEMGWTAYRWLPPITLKAAVPAADQKQCKHIFTSFEVFSRL